MNGGATRAMCIGRIHIQTSYVIIKNAAMCQQVFITGATGYLGRRVVPTLIARGHAVRALVRRGSESKGPAGAEIVVGDPFNRATFAAAIASCDTFLQLVGVPHPSPSKAREFREIDLRS